MTNTTITLLNKLERNLSYINEQIQESDQYKLCTDSVEFLRDAINHCGVTQLDTIPELLLTKLNTKILELENETRCTTGKRVGAFYYGKYKSIFNYITKTLVKIRKHII